ncbi:unnamed protein product [Pleuronectes platessa]|uniref:Uncharacterized protein n=1 Tax=Pleuronectes platessa TaxID=8262 RepID=A0A9N7U5L2_PLEPL|nr:unnamed protein product [Pleuronectes platessa]
MFAQPALPLALLLPSQLLERKSVCEETVQCDVGGLGLSHRGPWQSPGSHLKGWSQATGIHLPVKQEECLLLVWIRRLFSCVDGFPICQISRLQWSLRGAGALTLIMRASPPKSKSFLYASHLYSEQPAHFTPGDSHTNHTVAELRKMDNSRLSSGVFLLDRLQRALTASCRLPARRRNTS